MLKSLSSCLYLLLLFLIINMQGISAENGDDASKSKKLQVSGYIQPQWQLGEQAAVLSVGKEIEPQNNGVFDRVGIRRSRIKLEYDDNHLGSGVFQFNVAERVGNGGAHVQIKELYVNIKSPWNKASSLQAGIFNTPFGFEICYSSSAVESSERARVVNALFSGGYDLGAIVTLRPKQNSPLNFMTLKTGFLAGNGVNPEIDNRKDLIAQLKGVKSLNRNTHLGFGLSYYYGGVYQSNDTVYAMNGNQFDLSVSSLNKGAYAKREYFGVDAQFNFNSGLGATQLRGEYILGTLPGTRNNNTSPRRSQLPIHEDTYVRPFSGGYIMLLQNLGKSPFTAVLKYDLYDPNSAVKGNQIGVADTFTGIADIQYSTLGAGLYWQISPQIRTTLYYEFIANERTTALANNDFMKD